jgi:hypothetical protein
MAISDIDISIDNKLSFDSEQRIKAIKRLRELSKPQKERFLAADGNIYDNSGELVAEEPSYEQKQWVLFRLSHSNTWPNVHENKIGNPDNWRDNK